MKNLVLFFCFIMAGSDATRAKNSLTTRVYACVKMVVVGKYLLSKQTVLCQLFWNRYETRMGTSTSIMYNCYVYFYNQYKWFFSNFYNNQQTDGGKTAACLEDRTTFLHRSRVKPMLKSKKKIPSKNSRDYSQEELCRNKTKMNRYHIN